MRLLGEYCPERQGYGPPDAARLVGTVRSEVALRDIFSNIPARSIVMQTAVMLFILLFIIYNILHLSLHIFEI